MNEEQYRELLAAVTALHKRLDKLERSKRSSTLLTGSNQTYLKEIREEAAKMLETITIEPTR